jgi:probable F420-dependent oxidoreductase
VPPGVAATEPETLRLVAERAESLGYDSIWIGDHVVIPRDVRSRYPLTVEGVPNFKADHPMAEVLSTLTYLAGCTRRIRLGTNVLIVPSRPPVLTAKQLAVLDVLSGGRLTVGVGVGWMAEEFQALGAPPFSERGAVTDEYLQLFKILWTEDRPVFHGKYCQIPEVAFFPKPVQKPHPPIWVGGWGGPALRRAAELGDAWLPLGTIPAMPLRPDELRPKIAQLRDLTRLAGRQEVAVNVCLGAGVAFVDSTGVDRLPLKGHPEQIAQDLEQYQALGVNDFILFFALPGDTTALLEGMERFVREVVPLVRDHATSTATKVRGL